MIHLLVATLLQVGLCATTQQPHIVVIIADDLGWNDVSFHGSDQIPTPNIDALAYNGVILNRHYTLPICTPSRAAFLTGKYPIRTGMQGYPLKAGEPRGLPLVELTLPQGLQQLGYVTRLVGKWHQGNYRTEFTPTRRGFDSFLGYWNGYNGYYSDSLSESGRLGFNFRRDLCLTHDHVGQYATHVFTREAEDIIGRHDMARPLYLQLAHLAVHTGNDDRPMEVPNPDEAMDKYAYIADKERRLYAAMVAELDASVGRVVRALAARGMLNNTVLVFMSDNGAPTLGPNPNWGSNWPLRGMKFTLHEGGVRNVAAIWSASLQQPGRVSNQLIHLTDWLPTLYSAAGGDVADLGRLDGVDQWASLIGSKQVEPRTQLLLNIDDVQNASALIDGTLKVTRGDYNNGALDGYYGDDGRGPENPPYNVTGVLESDTNVALDATGRPLDEAAVRGLRAQALVRCPTHREPVSCLHDYCLYDVIADPCETRNLAGERGDTLQRLVEALDSYRAEAVAQLNKPVDPAADPVRNNGSWVSWLDDPGSIPVQCDVEPVNLLYHAVSGAPNMGRVDYQLAVTSCLLLRWLRRQT